MGNSRGFLLLEIIVAMVLIVSGLLFIGRVYSTAKEVIVRSRASFISSFLLEEKMFDIQTAEKIEAGTFEGEFPDNKSCYWKSEVAPASPQDTGLFKVTVGVFLSPKKSLSDAYWLETYIAKKNVGA